MVCVRHITFLFPHVSGSGKSCFGKYKRHHKVSGASNCFERQVAAKYTVYLSLPHREESDNHMVSVKEEPNYCCCPSPL